MFLVFELVGVDVEWYVIDFFEMYIGIVQCKVVSWIVYWCIVIIVVIGLKKDQLVMLCF